VLLAGETAILRIAPARNEDTAAACAKLSALAPARNEDTATACAKLSALAATGPPLSQPACVIRFRCQCAPAAARYGFPISRKISVADGRYTSREVGEAISVFPASPATVEGGNRGQDRADGDFLRIRRNLSYSLVAKVQPLTRRQVSARGLPAMIFLRCPPDGRWAAAGPGPPSTVYGVRAMIKPRSAWTGADPSQTLVASY
jgi:hypothetical protein